MHGAFVSDSKRTRATAMFSRAKTLYSANIVMDQKGTIRLVERRLDRTFRKCLSKSICLHLRACDDVAARLMAACLLVLNLSSNQYRETGDAWTGPHEERCDLHSLIVDDFAKASQIHSFESILWQRPWHKVNCSRVQQGQGLVKRNGISQRQS